MDVNFNLKVKEVIVIGIVIMFCICLFLGCCLEEGKLRELFGMFICLGILVYVERVVKCGNMFIKDIFFFLVEFIGGLFWFC